MRTASVPAPLRAVWRHPVAGPLLRVALGYVLIVEVLLQFIFGQVPLVGVGLRGFPVPRGIFVNGMVVGSLYALVAMGLILVYRANRIINFAQAALGSVPAVVALILVARKGMPYLLAVPIVFVGAAALGALVEVVFIRRFARAPRLILTVATIGVSLILAFVEFFIPNWISGESLPPTAFPTPFQRFKLDIGIVRFTGDHFFTVLVVGVLFAALAAFFRFTDMGIAVRASAENGERASLLGIPVRRVATVVWIIAAVFSGVGVFLRAPLVGLPIGGLIGPSVLLFGLAAAVIARMESLPTAFVAGMMIGIIDQTAVFSTRRATLANAVMLVVILIALLAQKGKLSRAYDTGVSTFQAVKEFRPIPNELRLVKEVVLARGALGLLVFELAVMVPLIVNENLLGRMTLILIYTMIGTSMVVLTGWAGQISLGQFGFAGIGAAVAGGLAANHQADFFLTIIVAGVAGAVVAILIGLPALRIQGLFLAVTTLAFSFTVSNFVLTREYFGWLLPGQNEFVERPVLWGRLDVTSDLRFYYLCLFFTVLVMGSAYSLRRYRSGRVLIGVRDNSRLMQAFGVNLARTRLAAFALSGFMAAIAGALLSYQQGTVDAGTYGPARSIELFAMTVIGGLTSLLGPILGALYVLGIPFFLEDSIENIGLLSTGAGQLLLLLLLPGGLAEFAFTQRDQFLRWVAKRNDIHVPSLVADSLVGHEEEEREQAAGATLTGIERHLEEIEHGPPALVCPVCHERVPVELSLTHPHFVEAEAVAAGTGNGAAREVVR